MKANQTCDYLIRHRAECSKILNDALHIDFIQKEKQQRKHNQCAAIHCCPANVDQGKHSIILQNQSFHTHRSSRNNNNKSRQTNASQGIFV